MPAFEFDRNAPISDAWDRDFFAARRSRRNRAVVSGGIALLGGGVVLGGALLALGTLRDGVNTKEETVTVCDKEYIPNTDGGGEYRVYVADAEGDRHTRRVADTLFVGGTRFDSADFYAGLDRGTTYDLKISGYRVGVLSSFPNIIEAERVAREQQVNYCEL